MPSLKLPSDEYPDPLTLLRDTEWEQHWPPIVLRGIHDIMAKEIKAGSGSLRQSYTKAFNITILTLVRKTRPRRAEVSNGTFTLTPFGEKINQMYSGDRKVGGKADTSVVQKYGKSEPKKPRTQRLIPKRRRKKRTTKKKPPKKGMSKQDMVKETRIKMKKLRLWIDMLVKTMPDAMPDQSPVRTI